MGIQRFIFFSIHNAEKHPEVPLMLIKACTERYLQQSGLDYTIFRLCGFMQVSLAVTLCTICDILQLLTTHTRLWYFANAFVVSQADPSMQM